MRNQPDVDRELTSRSHPYVGRVASLATRHDKLPLIAPVMHERLGLRVVSTDVDTDSLGTFTAEVPRLESPLSTAVTKARLGMRAAGLSLGLANEGSFGPLDDVPFVIADTEVVVLVDDDFGIEIAEAFVEIDPPAVGVDVGEVDVDSIPLARAGFPGNALIVRPSDGILPVFKGIRDPDHLRFAIEACIAASTTGQARVESDFRAHQHRQRRLVISRAAQRLAERLATLCPECCAPGWGEVERIGGAPCSECGEPTRLAKAERLACARCDLERINTLPAADGVDPGCCSSCNP